jgi:hypothetical protein
MRRVRLGKAVEVSGVSIVPVERVIVNGDCHPHGITVSAEIEPVGIIVDDGTGRWAIGMDGERLDPEELMKR